MPRRPTAKWAPRMGRRWPKRPAANCAFRRRHGRSDGRVNGRSVQKQARGAGGPLGSGWSAEPEPGGPVSAPIPRRPAQHQRRGAERRIERDGRPRLVKRGTPGLCFGCSRSRARLVVGGGRRMGAEGRRGSRRGRRVCQTGNRQEAGGRAESTRQSRANPAEIGNSGVTAARPPRHVTIPPVEGCHVTIPAKGHPTVLPRDSTR